MKIITVLFAFLLSNSAFTQTWEELDATLMKYFDEENYQMALVYAEKTVAQAEVEFGKNHVNYALSLGSVAFLQNTLGQYQDAIGSYEKSLPIWEHLQGKNSEGYTRTINNMANAYSKSGNYSKAVIYYKEGVEICKSIYGEKHPDYGVAIHNLATLYYDIDQFDLALPLYQDAIAIFSKGNGEMAEEYAYCVNNLGNIYAKVNENDKALSLFIEAKDILKVQLGEEHPRYAVIVGNLAEMMRMAGKPLEAVTYYLEALEIQAKTVGLQQTDAAMILNNLGLLQLDLGDYQDAIDSFSKAISILDAISNGKHRDLITYMSNLAAVYGEMNQSKRQLELLKEAVEKSFLYLNESFSYLSESEKEKVSESFKYLYSSFNSYAFQFHNSWTEIGDITFDVQLATKGMVLQSMVQMRQAIQESGDKSAIAQFDQLIKIREEIAQLSISKDEEDYENMRVLTAKANAVEGNLSSISSSFSAINSVGKTTWQDVQASLKEGEAVIEFAAFDFKDRKTGKLSKQYCAILLKLNQHPVFVPLFDETEIQSLLASESVDDRFINSIYRGEPTANVGVQINLQSKTKGKLYELIWKPLEKELLESNKIYFAPTGILNTISFAAIALNDSTLLSDRCHLVQLTTTANIVNRTIEIQKPKNIALFGGIDFDHSLSEKGDGTTESIKVNETVLASRGNQNWGYLPGTLKEVNAIEKIALEQKILSKKWEGSAAREGTIKQLSNTSPEILHLATHGFYIPSPQASEKKEKLSFENAQGKNNTNPLHQSGLLLAGGNYSWNNKMETQGEDGILTAYEVSNLSLNKTNLVVLSACETGLGQIKGNEGVYGLQRAFKMAGVEYIIMSLWQIPDKESAEFMELFYIQYFQTGDIENAFRSAQNSMKDRYFSDPYKWAAFVLVR